MMAWGWIPFGGFLSLLFVVALVVAGALLVRSAGRSGGSGAPSRSAGLEVLEERYARGEIGRDEYLQKKGDMAASPPNGAGPE